MRLVARETTTTGFEFKYRSSDARMLAMSASKEKNREKARCFARSAERIEQRYRDDYELYKNKLSQGIDASPPYGTRPPPPPAIRRKG